MRVAVIGSGLGGLLAAASLRKAGVDVIRFEKGSHPGGRARSLELGGERVNPGPRAMFAGLPLERALASFGIQPASFRPASRPWGLLAGGLVEMPGDAARLLGARFLDGRDKRVIALLMARIGLGRLPAALDAAPGSRLGDWLDRHAPTPRARALVRTLVRLATYCDDEDVDADLALRQVRHGLTKGVRYVDGGWSTLVDGLEPLAGPLEHREVTRLDDIDADGIIVATSIDEARRLVSLPGTPPPVTASCLDVVLERLPDPARRLVLGIDRPLYLSVHARDERAGPVRVHLMGYGSASREELEGLLDVAQPRWRDVTRATRYLPRMVVSSRTPRFDRTPIESARGGRVHVVGDFVETGHLLADGAAASAVAAVRRIVGAATSPAGAAA